MLHTGKSTTFLAIDDASNDVCHMVADQMTAKKIPKQTNASKSIYPYKRGILMIKSAEKNGSIGIVRIKRGEKEQKTGLWKNKICNMWKQGRVDKNCWVA